MTVWAAPHVSAARLVFAATWTAYILVAIRFEERDLEDMHGEAYGRYREQVPMIITSPWRRASEAG